MGHFTTRVELHGAIESDYKTLHEEMGKEGFTRYIKKDGEPSYELPTAEYNKVGEFTTIQVRDCAKRAAEKTKKTFSILVTKSDGPREWFNLKKA